MNHSTSRTAAMDGTRFFLLTDRADRFVVQINDIGGEIQIHVLMASRDEFPMNR
jgi:hypothetical protein